MFMEPSMRWYGPNDRVPLSFIRQAGAEGVVTSLHHIPYGEVWSRGEIEKRSAEVDAAGLFWNVVESLPVHEDVKLRSGDFLRHIENYRESLRNLGACGIRTVVYNFMPVLDWIRTDLRYRLPDGSEALYFNRLEFAAFELFILKRAGAAADYPPAAVAEAEKYFAGLPAADREALCRNIIDNFPGFKGVTLDAVRGMLARYAGVGADELRENLRLFLEAVVPVAEEAGVKLAIHPDDPPRPILGLPRIFSTMADIEWLLKAVDSPANCVNFCSGSFSGRLDNNVTAMFKSCASRVAFLHLRSTEHLANGDFFEANHLEGVVDMYALVKLAVAEQKRRQAAGRADWRIPFRPDHGHTMMDDLAKPPCANPGYTAIGRMKGLAEIRGLEYAIMRGEDER